MEYENIVEIFDGQIHNKIIEIIVTWKFSL